MICQYRLLPRRVLVQDEGAGAGLLLFSKEYEVKLMYKAKILVN